VVIVADRHAHAEALAAHARLLRDVRKSAIAVITIKVVRSIYAVGFGELGRAVNVAPAQHVEVQETVIVVIEPGAAGTGGLHDRAQLLLAERVPEIDTGF